MPGQDLRLSPQCRVILNTQINQTLRELSINEFEDIPPLSVIGKIPIEAVALYMLHPRSGAVQDRRGLKKKGGGGGGGS